MTAPTMITLMMAKDMRLSAGEDSWHCLEGCGTHAAFHEPDAVLKEGVGCKDGQPLLGQIQKRGPMGRYEGPLRTFEAYSLGSKHVAPERRLRILLVSVPRCGEPPTRRHKPKGAKTCMTSRCF